MAILIIQTRKKILQLTNRIDIEDYNFGMSSSS